MCDLPDCEKSSPMRKVFHGCAHSFHIQCLLPNISDCPHCHSLLMAQVEVLGKAVNDSVSVEELTENMSGEDSDQEDDDFDEEIQDDDTNEPNCPSQIDIHNLLEKISQWRRS